MEEYQRLAFAIKSVCKIHDVWVQDLFDGVERFNKDITEGVFEDLCDTPYSTCQIAEPTSSENDQLIIRDLSVLSNVKPGMIS